MKSYVCKVFGVCFIMTACLLTFSLFLSTRAFAEAELYVFESRIKDRCATESNAAPRGYFNYTDPTLVRSESDIFPSTYGHDDCHDEEFQDLNVYQDPVRVNHEHRFCMPGTEGFIICAYNYYPHLPHSDATATGFASAGRLRLGAYSEATDALFLEQIDYVGRGTQSQSEADASFRNRFTILPGNSGLPAGAPVRLRWHFRLHGSTQATGRTFPQKTGTLADVNFGAKVVRGIEVCQPEDGRIFCSHPSAAEFGLRAHTEGQDSDPNNPFTPDETGNISHYLDWSAYNNLGQQLGTLLRDRIVYGREESDAHMFGSFPVDSDSLVSSLEFEATVGETLEIRADLSTLAIVGGGAGSSSGGTLGSTRNDFFGTFNNSVVDPENRGLQLAFEIPPETLNDPPVANAGQDGSGNVGSMITLDGRASTDSDNGPSPLNFHWFQNGGPATVTLTGDTTATPTFTPPVEGTYMFRLIVNDGELGSGPDDVEISVTATKANRAPVARCQDVTVPTAVDSCATISASIDHGSSDPDGTTPTLTQSPAGPYPVGTTPVTLTASDGSLSSQCAATVTVTDAQAPAITCPADQTVTATSSSGAVVNFTPSTTDNCSTLMTSCTTASGATFPLGTTTVTCTATDGASLQKSCSFNVQVVPAPVTTVPFTNVSAALAVERGRTRSTGSLEYQMTFTLGAGNNGIAPPTEPVTVQIGSLTFPIPAGSFRANPRGKFTFTGMLSGVSVEASIIPVSSGRYQLKLDANRLNASGFTNPVSTQVSIGNDTGSATVRAKCE